MIQDIKKNQVSEICKGDKVLYVGVGNAEDAVLAAQKGAFVTCIDISTKMLESARKKFRKAGVEGEFLCMDVMQYGISDYFDVIIANFFLNIFPEKTMPKVLKHITSLVKINGQLIIADFSPPQNESIKKYLHLMYCYIANISFWLIGLAPLHKVYNYSNYFHEADLKLKKINRYSLKLFPLPVYQNILTIRV